MTRQGPQNDVTVCTATDRPALESLLGRHVALNTYLLGVLARPCANPIELTGDGRFYAQFEGPSGGSVIYVSHTGLVVPYGLRPASVGRLASAIWPDPPHASRSVRPFVRLVVGPSDAVGAVLGAITATFRPRLDRLQRQYEITPAELTVPAGASVERAGHADVPELSTLLATMQAEEFGFDPKQFDTPAFRTRIQTLVETGRVFVKRQAGEIVFHTSANATSSHGAQIEAVYTARHCRGAGLASSALGAAAASLLTTLPRLVLGVADDNTPAIRLYRRLGFQPTVELRLATA
jgi:RimJ/RimL family protein N-acetyltransferase